MPGSRSIDRLRSLSPATSVALAYALGAGLWIVASDWLLAAAAGTPEADRQLHTLKGWSFVLVTTGLLWIVLQRFWMARLVAKREGAASERRLLEVLEALSAVLLRLRGEAPYPIVSVSAGAAAGLGYEPGELVEWPARSVLELLHPQDRSGLVEALEAAAGEESFVAELRWLHRSGESRWTWCKGRRDERSGDVELLVVDVSRVKRLEAEIVHAHALESLAELAAGVAHDLNNFLTAMLGHAELGSTTPCSEAATDEHAHHFAAVLAAAEQARSLNRRLLALGRSTPERREAIDLGRLVEAAAELLGPMLRQRAHLVIDRYPDPVPVVADPRQLERVLVNLAVNARDALTEGGELRIGAECLDADPAADPSLAHVPPGRYGCLVVADTGAGIAPEHRDRIFEPFFTTKPLAEGSGLGLAIVAGLVEQQGGHITVESTLGVGTTFRVLLPLATNAGDQADRN